MTSSGERYVLKDFPGSSHRILAGWVRELPAGNRILELGPGIGHIARLVGKRDGAWLGLEASLPCIGELRRLLTGGAIVNLETLERLPPWPDTVLAADTLEHLSDPPRMLRAIHAALRPGGRLLLSVPNVANLYVRLNLLVGRFPYAERGILDRTHKFFFTHSTLRAMVREAGFDVERWAVSSIPLPLVFPAPPAVVGAPMVALHALTRVLPRLLGYQLLLSARRT